MWVNKMIQCMGWLTAALVFAFTAATAQELPNASDHENFYEDRKRGWYWYEPEPAQETEILPEPAPLEEKVSLNQLTYQELWDLHPDQFKAYAEEITKIAVGTPSEDNVLQYLLVQDVTRRKALAFASVVGMVGQKYPRFGTEGVYPTTLPGQKALTTLRYREVDQLIRGLGGEFALIMFTQPGCGFCDAQNGVLNFFEDNYNWPVRRVDIAADPLFAARFGVEQTPSVILVNKFSKDYMPISSGVVSLSEFKKRIFRAVRLMKQTTRPEQWGNYDFELKTPGDPLEPLRRARTGVQGGPIEVAEQ